MQPTTCSAYHSLSGHSLGRAPGCVYSTWAAVQGSILAIVPQLLYCLAVVLLCCCTACRYYGCGSPFPVGLQGSGLRVLDLGCGTGRDCYVCAALVGEKGFVTGVDMTDAQLAHATQHSTAWQQHLGYKQPNMR